MRFDTSQQMRMGQQMKLAPRMIQSMEILQLNQLALEERIAEELESNVALDTLEHTADNSEASQQEREELQTSAGDRELHLEEGGADDFERLDEMESSYSEAFDNAYESSKAAPDRHDSYEPSRQRSSDGERDSKMDAMANTAGRSKSLPDQLLEQWAFIDADRELSDAGKLLIDHIDDDGYIRTELSVIADTGPRDGNGQARFDEVFLEKALARLQTTLEPVGLAARDTVECLLLQIDAYTGSMTVDEDEHAAWVIVRELVQKHLDDLVHNRIPKVARLSGLDVDSINASLKMMSKLMINPGRMLVEVSTPGIVPDAIVEWDDETNDYLVFLSDGRLPNLSVNREYAEMSRDKDIPKSERDFLKKSLGNAHWLIDAIEQRRQTLMRVVKAVIAAQRDFLDQGPESIRPLPMTQVADQLGIHVATVSRAVAGKHLQTPRGVLPLRQFFTGGTQTTEGEDVAWDAIKAALREVVDNENKSKPLSDEAIVKALNEKGFEIARRTVAKYRAQLDIPPARMRKTFQTQRSA